MRLSYSKLNTYRQCPLRYRFTYLDRLPRRPRRLFRAARRIHYALMRWLVYAKSGPPRWEEVQAAYDSAWGALQEPGVRSEPEYLEGLEILRAYQEANADRPCQPIFQEQKFQIHLGAHTLSGVMDRVDATDTGYEVIDYKLDRELRSQETVENDLQLALYALAMEEAHGIRPEALTLYFLRHNVQRTITRTEEQTRELRHWVTRTGDDLAAARRFEPCVGGHCGGCDFKSACPAHTGKSLPPLVRLEPRRTEPAPSLVLPGLLEPLTPLAPARAGARSGVEGEGVQVATQLALPWE